MTYDELLNQYPPEEWVENEEEDGYCATCRNGAICQSAITVDVVDICTEAGVQPLLYETICLQWLTDNNLSSLKEVVTELTAQFKRFLAVRDTDTKRICSQCGDELPGETIGRLHYCNDCAFIYRWG